jgi:hypothetical protein
VSPDAAIAIVFGLVGAIISFAGVAIACLTLRFMMSALPFLHCQPQSAFCSSVYVDRVLKQMSEFSEYMTIVRFFVMSTCISSHYLRVKDRGKELRGPSNDDCSAFIEGNFYDDSHIVMNAVQSSLNWSEMPEIIT